MALKQKYKAASLYESFVQEYGAEEINQKDFAMYLRLQVERDNGILKRSSHGIYELRTDPSDKGISFSRNSKEMDIPPFEEDELIAGICKEEGKADLNELFNDMLIMASRLQNTAKLMENQAATSTDLGELHQLRKCISKELDELITSTSALIAWDADHQVIIPSRKELKNMSIQEINRIKNHYPVGTRIELISMDDAYAPLPSGMRGTVDYVDDDGQMHMKWDNGRTLAIIPGLDKFRKLTFEELEAENFTEDISEDNPIGM